jgi:hypothetical protein
MYRIETGPKGDKHRLVADAVLGEAEFAAIVLAIGARPVRARKTGLIAARKAATRETVETRWNGEETTNTAEPGDWIVTSLSPDGKVLRDAEGNANSYVIRSASFPTLYKPAKGENEFGRLHASSSTVDALHLPGGFAIIGPWGKPQSAPDGYLVRNGTEVYGNNAETFTASYEVIG